MAEEEKKSSFPWIQLIATVGTIIAALIGITPYILKLNTPPAPQTPTIVIVTLPPAVITPVPPPTTLPVTTAETTPVTTQTTTAATTATTGPPPTATETTVTTTPVETTVPTVVTTLPAGPAIQVSVNATSVPQGGAILATVSTDPGVSQVTIILRNSTTFASQPANLALVQGMVTLSLDTAPYAPGDYTISAAVPDTQALASASFVIT